MSDQAPAKNGNGKAAGRQFALHRLYVKDVSFESPNVPAVFTEKLVEPEINLNLRTSHRDLGQGRFEVVLHVNVQARVGERTMFLVELDQAGEFELAGFPAEEIRMIVGVACPNALFPYAREAVSSLVQKGGFPPLLLQPIDFAALFAQQQQAQAGNA